MRVEYRLSGSGGQGLVLAGKVLAHAAALHAGFEATQTKSYGPEARGGASRSDVVVSDEPIDYPKALHLDCLLALTDESFRNYQADVKPGGLVVVDEGVGLGEEESRFSLYATPIVRTAETQLGRRLFANLVALGVVCGLVPVVPADAVVAAIPSSVPSGTAEANVRAFRLGLGLATGAAPLRSAVQETAVSEEVRAASARYREARSRM